MKQNRKFSSDILNLKYRLPISIKNSSFGSTFSECNPKTGNECHSSNILRKIYDLLDRLDQSLQKDKEHKSFKLMSYMSYKP